MPPTPRTPLLGTLPTSHSSAWEIWSSGMGPGSARNDGTTGATALSAWVDGFGANSVVRTLAVSAVVLVFVCLYAASASGGVPMGSWGIVRVGGTGADEPVETLEERCARLARLRGLTKHEEEVMVLLVKSEPFAQIEEGLSISNSTLKTHARHIYAKLEVSGRRELAELIEQAL